MLTRLKTGYGFIFALGLVVVRDGTELAACFTSHLEVCCLFDVGRVMIQAGLALL